VTSENLRKQFSSACERNREPILSVLEDVLADADRVLEVGSGTGQHAVFFAGNLPHLEWQPSNRPGHLDSIRAWRNDAGLPNIAEPIELDLFEERSVEPVDAVVAINVIHIAPWPATERLFEHASQVLTDDGLVYLYGPFRYAERALESSNQRFDQWLKERDPQSGIRQFEEVDAVAQAHGFECVEDRAMPANNRSIWWRRTG
jgi:cyclopropane fatty-acyl-phospholipid synthase-like methyltransferase